MSDEEAMVRDDHTSESQWLRLAKQGDPVRKPPKRGFLDGFTSAQKGIAAAAAIAAAAGSAALYFAPRKDTEKDHATLIRLGQRVDDIHEEVREMRMDFRAMAKGDPLPALTPEPTPEVAK